MSRTANSPDSLVDALAAARKENLIAESTEKNVRQWLSDPAYSKYRDAVAEHIELRKFRELDDAFWAVLPFGTGGRRGKMYPIGINVMNERTVGESAQGLAEYLRQALGRDAELSCVIAYDTRNRSAEFARLSASVLAGNGVRVFIFPDCRATPQLSFAVRDLKATAGIVISASHNPPSDNGFKCSWSTGGQVLPPHDTGIIHCVESVREIRSLNFDEGVRNGVIRVLGPEHDSSYVRAVVGESRTRERSIRVVYSPLHGVGLTSVLRALCEAGFDDVHVVEAQATPDGNFPNVADHAPNPENPAVLREAIELAQQLKADLVLASDPDADRIAAAVPNGQGNFVPLSGNQTAALLTHHVVSHHVRSGNPVAGYFVVKTLVTTELISRIAEGHGLAIHGELPVGFKWIAEAMDQYGADKFLFGAEESLGYLAGEYARDKDAAVAALFFAEMAAGLKREGTSVLDHLDGLYRKYGYHLERAVSKSRPGRQGASEISQIMHSLRTRPPQEMAGMRITRVHDFVDGLVRDTTSSQVVPLRGSRQQQVMFEFERPGWRLVARPSGTEPKIKFYLFGVVPPDQLASADSLTRAKRDAAATMDEMASGLENVISAALNFQK